MKKQLLIITLLVASFALAWCVNNNFMERYREQHIKQEIECNLLSWLYIAKGYESDVCVTRTGYILKVR